MRVVSMLLLAFLASVVAFGHSGRAPLTWEKSGGVASSDGPVVSVFGSGELPYTWAKFGSDLRHRPDGVFRYCE